MDWLRAFSVVLCYNVMCVIAAPTPQEETTILPILTGKKEIRFEYGIFRTLYYDNNQLKTGYH